MLFDVQGATIFGTDMSKPACATDALGEIQSLKE